MLWVALACFSRLNRQSRLKAFSHIHIEPLLGHTYADACSCTHTHIHTAVQLVSKALAHDGRMWLPGQIFAAMRGSNKPANGSIRCASAWATLLPW
eukprot:213437-Pelagomonas_calceolata.AAC.3